MARLTYEKGNQSESNQLASNEEQGMKMPGVTRIRPETGRSNPGQGEAGVKPRGGLQRYCVQAFF